MRESAVIGHRTTSAIGEVAKTFSKKAIGSCDLPKVERGEGGQKHTRRFHLLGLQLRLELGNVVTGEEEKGVVGDKTDKVWEGKPTCVKPPETNKLHSTTHTRHLTYGTPLTEPGCTGSTAGRS